MKAVEAYLKSVPKERLQHIKALHDLIVKLFPDATVDMKYKEKHPNFKTGKGCINFKESDTLPIQDLKRVIQHAIWHPKGS